MSRWLRLAVGATCLAVVTKLPTLTNSIIFIDEPIYLNQASLLDSPEAFVFAFLYRIETKFPLGLLPYIAAERIDWQNALLILHLFGVVAVAISVYLVLSISHRAFHSFAPGAIAAIAWCIYLARDAQTASTLLEYFQTPLLLASVLLFITAQQRIKVSYVNICVAGVLLGLAALVKPPALAVAPVMLVILGSTDRRWIDRARATLALGVSVMLPIVVFVVPYLFRPDALEALKFSMITLTESYSLQGNASAPRKLLNLLAVMNRGDVALIVGADLVFAATFVSDTVKKVPREAATFAGEIFIIGLALFLGYSIGQAKNHYIIPVLPFLMLFAGQVLNSTYQKARGRFTKLALMGALGAVFAASLVPVVFYYPHLWADGGREYAQQMDVDAVALARYIDGHSTAKDRIWVYYNAPEVYWKADRKPATDDPTATFLIDSYDDFWFMRTRDQLATSQPAIIIGIQKPRFPRTKVAALTDLPDVGDLLRERYGCSSDVIANTVVCLRRPGTP